MATTTTARAISLRESRERIFRNARDIAALFRAAQRTSARIMAADAPGQNRPSASRRLVHRKAAYPDPPPRQYRRVGISYLRRQETADGIRTTSFHQKVSPCSDAGKAIAHMDYIERESAVVASFGTISGDPEGRRALWTELADRATPSRGTITLPANASPELRRALQPILDDLARRARVPRRAAAAWLRRAKHPLRIRGLHPDAYNDLAAALAGAYQRGIDPQFPTEPAKAGQPCALPTKAGIRGYIPRAPTVQMRMILELPHDVTPLAREQILRNYCDQQFRDRGIPYHAVIHRPAEGNDARNHHAHIVWTHHRVARDPVTREWDFLASRTLPRVHDFGRVLTCAARGPDGKPLPYAERRKAMSAAFRQMRHDFAVIANEQLTNHAAHRRYDPRSYADRGIDATPSIHVGPAATAAASKPRPSASPAAPGRNPHLAAWHNFAAAAADHLPDEDRDEITAAVATDMLVSSLPATLINPELIDQQQRYRALLDRIRKAARRRRPRVQSAATPAPVRDRAALQAAPQPEAEMQDIVPRRRPRVQSAATPAPVRDRAALKTARQPEAELQDIVPRRRPRVQSAATPAPVRDRAALKAAPAIADEQALARYLAPHIPDFGDAILHALHHRSSLHLTLLPDLGPQTTHCIALALAPYAVPHSPDHPSREPPAHAIRRWRTHFDTGLSPRAIRALPHQLARAAFRVYQYERAYPASPSTPKTAADTRALLAPHLYALVTATILGPHLRADEPPPLVPGLAPDAIAAVMRVLQKPLRPHVPRHPGRFLDEIQDAYETANQLLDDIAKRIHRHGRRRTLHLLAPPKLTRSGGTSVER